MQSQQKTQISFVSDVALKEKALEKAKKEGVTLKALLTMAMRAYVKNELVLGLQKTAPDNFELGVLKESEVIPQMRQKMKETKKMTASSFVNI